MIGDLLRLPVNALRPLGRMFVHDMRELRHGKQAQKNLLRALLRANALNGSLVAVMMPLHGGRYETAWRFVVGLTLLMIVLERALFEWHVPRPADKKPSRWNGEWPRVPIFLEEGPVEPVNLTKYTSRRPATTDEAPTRFRLDVDLLDTLATEQDAEQDARGGAS